MQTPGTLPPFDPLLMTAPDAMMLETVQCEVSTLHTEHYTALDREQIADNLHLHQAKCLSHYVELSLMMLTLLLTMP